MKKQFTGYLIGIIILTAVSAGFVILLSSIYGFELPSVTAGIYAFLLFTTVGVHFAFMFSSRQGGETSVSLLMASILAHLVVNIIFILLILYFNQEDAYTITFMFFGSFIVFMIYEIVMISLFINAKRTD